MPKNINPFSLFKTHEINDVINNFPILYGKFRKSGIFLPEPLLDDMVLIDEESGELTIAEARAPGSPGQGVDRGNRAMRAFQLPHFPFDTHVNPRDVSNLRQTGSNQRQKIAVYLANRLKAHKMRHDITMEYLCAGALQGVIRDGSGATLLNLWSEFNQTQEVLSLSAVGNDTAKFRKLFRDIGRIQEDALKADTMTHTELPVSRALFDAIVDHPVVQKHYLNNQFAPGYLKEDVRKVGINIEGVKVWEYEAAVKLTDGSSGRIIPTDEGVAYPAGTSDLFKLYHAPSDFNEDSGRFGKPYYVKIEPGKMNRGYDIHSQFNSLPVCKRPGVLVKVTL